MELKFNGIAVSVSNAAIEQLVRERISGGELLSVQTSTRDALPAIGTAYQGGLYAGLTIHDEIPYSLVLLPGDFKGDWETSLDWADKEDGILPSRFDQLVLFKNLKSEFKPECYWSSEVYASLAGYAWMQFFDYGDRYFNYVGTHCRARAVRRLPIE